VRELYQHISNPSSDIGGGIPVRLWVLAVHRFVGIDTIAAFDCAMCNLMSGDNYIFLEIK
jgi:hypothetical protein